MSALVQQRCLRHRERQAVARCPECRLFYCRECITEHDDRILCADCLKKKIGPAPEASRHERHLLRRLRHGIGRLLLIGLAVGVSWIFFYGYGKLFLAIPTSFHNGTIWENLPLP